MFSNEIRSIRAALGGFTSPLSENDRELVRLARANLEALAVQIDEWEGHKPGVSISIREIHVQPEGHIHITPDDVGKAVADSLGSGLGNMGGF